MDHRLPHSLLMLTWPVKFVKLLSVSADGALGKECGAAVAGADQDQPPAQDGRGEGQQGARYRLRAAAPSFSEDFFGACIC